MQKYDSIIFDLDGTLWDAVNSVCGIWNEALVFVGLEPNMNYEKLSRCMGLLIGEILERLIPQATNKQREAVIEYCLTKEVKYLSEHGGKLYDNVEDTLAELKEKYRLFIVSNCQDGYINAFFQSHGLRKYFEDYECAGRTGLSKGENIRLICNRNGLKSPIYVGDTVSDYKATKEADVPFVYAAYGFGDCDSYTYKADSFAQLPEVFE